MATRFENDVIFKGNATFSTIALPDNSVADGNIQTGSGRGVDADKLEHLYKAGTDFGLAIGGTVASEERIVFVASGSATIRTFNALMDATGSTGNSDFDLKVNGSSVLSAVVNIDNTDSNRTSESGTISSASLSADDVVSISVTRNSSHDGTGPYAWVDIDEGAP